MSRSSSQISQSTSGGVEKGNGSSQASSATSPRNRATNSQSSPKSPRGRHNKIYHCPPTPPPGARRWREKSFVLDSVASSSLSADYSRANPKLGQVIPSYNAYSDPGCEPYFQYCGVSGLMKRTMPPEHLHKIVGNPQKGGTKPIPHLDLEEQTTRKPPYTSAEGYTVDRFYRSRRWNGTGQEVDPSYVVLRNKQGAGHSREVVGGHDHFMRQRQTRDVWYDRRTRQMSDTVEDNIYKVRQEKTNKNKDGDAADENPDSKNRRSPYKEPVLSYNGRFGYRRNTPSLRQTPSQFGVATYSAIY